MRLIQHINETKVYLDDVRQSPKGWILVKNPTDMINLLKKNNVTEISLDHDLGDDKNIGTGYDVLLWIEEKVFKDKSFKVPKISIHTSNPSARKKMELALKSIERIISK